MPYTPQPSIRSLALSIRRYSDAVDFVLAHSIFLFISFLQCLSSHFLPCHTFSNPFVLQVAIMLRVASPLCLYTSNLKSSTHGNCNPSCFNGFGMRRGGYPYVTLGSAPKYSKFSSGCWNNCQHYHGNFVLRKRAVVIPWAVHGHIPEPIDDIAAPLRKRKVVEHIVLYRTKEGFSDDQEKDMLDFLYTSQYYMRGIMAISLGCILKKNPEGCTHALYMRFASKEVLAEFYRNPFQSRVVKEHIIPYCHESISVDYEAEVEDDIIPLFRRGEDFEYGVECFLLMSVKEDAPVDIVKGTLDAFANVIEDFGSTIIQCTQGINFSSNSKDYTHGIVIRFPSEKALEIFTGSPLYTDIWQQKILPITRKILTVYFLVDPVGKILM